MTGNGHLPSLVFKRLEIRRMPGFERQGFTLDHLSPGLNIIYGPNGSGKTTTMKAILRLLSSDGDGAGVDLYGVVQLDRSSWSVALDSAGHRWQKDGTPAARPPVPPGAHLAQYRLSLSELLQASELGAEFIARILRETSGGYDVAAAARALGFGEAPAGRQVARDALRQARQRLASCQRAAEVLNTQAEELEQLEAQRQQALRASKLVDQLETIKELLAARSHAQQLERALAGFPPWMERLTGQEAARLDELAEREQQLLREREEAMVLLRTAREELARTAFTGEVPAVHQLNAWRLECQDIRSLEAELQQAAVELAAAQELQSVEERRLGDQVDPTKVATIDANQIDRLADLLAAGQALAAQRRELTARLRALPAIDTGDPETLRRGIALLSEWLAVADPGRQADIRRFMLISLILVVLSVGIGIERWLAGSGLPAVLLLVLGLVTGVAAIPVWRHLFVRQPRQRGRIESDFNALDLKWSPDRWIPESVAACLERLHRELHQATAAMSAAEQRRTLQEELNRTSQEEADLQQRLEELAHQLGLPGSAGVRGMTWLVERVKEWQDAAAKTRQAAVALAQGRAELQARLRKLSLELKRFGYQEVSSAAQALGILDDLDRRLHDYQQAWNRLREAEQAMERCRQELERIATQRRRLLNTFDLDPARPGDEAILRQAVAEWNRFQQLKQNYLSANERSAALERRLQELNVDPALLGITGEQLEDRLQAARRDAGQLEALAKEIGGIEARIADAKKAREISDALAECERAETALRQLYHQAARSSLGALLAERLIAETRDSQRPRVFHRAREIFAEITSGRYRLELDDSTNPHAFRAVDQETGEGLSLSQLSDGTRLQLLMAVRMAFVEVHEDGARLPLLLDEVLANSDDWRAAAVMEAVVAFVRSGRQVFYFTAQYDEVAKWQVLLREQGVDNAIIDLGQIRRRALADQRLLALGAAPEPPAIPAPNDLTYWEYGKLLVVPHWDRFANSEDPVASVHLWHIMEDAGDLYALLQAGVETWGALRNLAETAAGRQWGERLQSAYAKARAGARALTAAWQAWCIGRGRPVDRDVLIASGAISDAFLDRVAALAEEHAGDARGIIDALAAGRVPRFRREAIRQLREYFEDHGYLDSRQPLDEDSIRAYVLFAVQDDLAAGLISRALIERLVLLVTEPGRG